LRQQFSAPWKAAKCGKCGRWQATQAATVNKCRYCGHESRFYRDGMRNIHFREFMTSADATGYIIAVTNKLAEAIKHA